MVQYELSNIVSVEFGRAGKLTFIRDKGGDRSRYIPSHVTLIEVAFQNKEALKNGEFLTHKEDWRIETTAYNSVEYVSFAHMDEYHDRIAKDCFNLTWEELETLETLISNREAGGLKRKGSSTSENEAKKIKKHEREVFRWVIKKSGEEIARSGMAFVSFPNCREDAQENIVNYEEGSYIDYLYERGEGMSLSELSQRTYLYLLFKECLELKAKADRNAEGENEEGESQSQISTSPPKQTEFDLKIIHLSHIRISVQRLYEATTAMVNIYKFPDSFTKSLCAETLRKSKPHEVDFNSLRFEKEFDALNNM